MRELILGRSTWSRENPRSSSQLSPERSGVMAYSRIAKKVKASGADPIRDCRASTTGRVLSRYTPQIPVAIDTAMVVIAVALMTRIGALAEKLIVPSSPMTLPLGGSADSGGALSAPVRKTGVAGSSGGRLLDGSDIGGGGCRSPSPDGLDEELKGHMEYA